MYNIKHNNLNEPMKGYMFERSNHEFHILRSNDISLSLNQFYKKVLAILGLYYGTICQ